MIKCIKCGEVKMENYYYSRDVYDSNKDELKCKLCNKREMNSIPLEENHKPCYECSTIKHFDEFSKCSKQKYEKATNCKECNKNRVKQRKDSGVFYSESKNSNKVPIYMSRHEVMSCSIRLLDRIKRCGNNVGLVDIADIIECYQQMSGKIHFSQTMKSGKEIVCMVAYLTLAIEKEKKIQ
jgi:hypothetical protein